MATMAETVVGGMLQSVPNKPFFIGEFGTGMQQ
jgi:hypothetical protein